MNSKPATRQVLVALTLTVVGGAGASTASALPCQWTRIDCPAPPARHSGPMVYDSAREVVVVFGGLDGGNEDGGRASFEWWSPLPKQARCRRLGIARP
jgi:hypothetical protein